MVDLTRQIVDTVAVVRRPVPDTVVWTRPGPQRPLLVEEVEIVLLMEVVGVRSRTRDPEPRERVLH